MIVGLISDTHGYLSPEALTALNGVGHIFHAGDIGSAEVLRHLRALAPVTAVRGNTDHADWSTRLPRTEMVVLNGICFYLLHDLTLIDLEPASTGIHVVISGHTHQHAVQRNKGVLYVNPGSASQPRHGGSVSIGRLSLSADPGELSPIIVRLDH